MGLGSFPWPSGSRARPSLIGHGFESKAKIKAKPKTKPRPKAKPKARRKSKDKPKRKLKPKAKVCFFANAELRICSL
jgi:hypothetical protein